MRVHHVHPFPDARYSENFQSAKNRRETTVGLADGQSRHVIDFHAGSQVPDARIHLLVAFILIIIIDITGVVVRVREHAHFVTSSREFRGEVRDV
jgi:hypothetical protein